MNSGISLVGRPSLPVSVPRYCPIIFHSCNVCYSSWDNIAGGQDKQLSVAISSWQSGLKKKKFMPVERWCKVQMGRKGKVMAERGRFEWLSVHIWVCFIVNIGNTLGLLLENSVHKDLCKAGDSAKPGPALLWRVCALGRWGDNQPWDPSAQHPQARSREAKHHPG